MYSKEEREKAIQLYIKYGKCAADVIRELGYPDRKTLRNWYKTYLETGMYYEQYSRRSKYSPEHKKATVKYYLEHGRNFHGQSGHWVIPHDKHSEIGAMN